MGPAVRIAPVEEHRVFRVVGIDCPECARAVEQSVSALPGVSEARVAFATGELRVRYDSLRTSGEEVAARVHSLGYEVMGWEPPGVQATTLRVSGMDCADCAAHLEKRVGMVPGVRQARVSFALGRLQVVHEGPVADILAAVESLGYRGEVEAGTLARPSRAVSPGRNRYFWPTVVSGAILAAAAALSWAGGPLVLVHAVYAAAALCGGYLPARAGLAVLRNTGGLDMNVLMSLAALGALGIGQFEEAAVVVFLFSLGNALQGYTLEKTRRAISSLVELAPTQALVRRDGELQAVPVQEVEAGDVVVVRPGEKIPVDGTVLAGSSSVNQAPITGESVPVAKLEGDAVLAGSINEHGSLEIRVTRRGDDTTMARLVHLVEEAQAQRAPSQQLVDRFARYYTPAVITAAGLVAVLPPLLGGQPFAKWFYEALAMLLVACPCALVISTPVAIVAAIGTAARYGVLIKGGAHLEELGVLSVTAFDKTGTLTVGRPEVTAVVALGEATPSQVLSIAAAIEMRSEHLLGAAILEHARRTGTQIPEASDFQAVPGLGAAATVMGQRYRVGSTRYFNLQGFSLAGAEEIVTRLQEEGNTVVAVGDEEKVIGVIALADALRPGAREAIRALREAGITRVVMLTGDTAPAARAIAARAGVDEVRAELLPEDKAMAVRELVGAYGKVAMVGDGVNDAPALAAATVGIAMGAAGTGVALETADIALMGDDLARLPYALRLGRRTRAIIVQNIAFSLVVKGLVLLLVVPGMLTLWLAVAADMGSSLLVTLNGMRLMRVRHQG